MGVQHHRHSALKMKNALFGIVLAMVWATSAAAVAEAAAVRAVVDRNRATVGDSIALQVVIEGGKGEVDLSRLTGFQTIPHGSSSSFQMINGRTSRQVIHNYALIPLAAGNLTIPGIPVTIGGQVFRTQPVSIVVSDQPPVDSGQRDVYVTAQVSEKAPWVGQQITYTFRLFNAVQVAEATFQAPAFDGFNAQELEDRQSHRTLINGREFVVTEVVFILVPLKTGAIEIEPAVLQVGLLQRSRQPRPFAGMDAFFGRTEMTTRMLETDAVAVKVAPLPPPPPGTFFSGLVGSFDMKADLDKADIRVGDATTLTVTVSGAGNIMDSPEPAIPAPAGFKSYADNPDTQVQTTPQGYSGRKTFRTALVPAQPGRFRIDPIMLTYFDAAAGNYRSLTSSAFDIAVAPSETAATSVDALQAPLLSTPGLKKRVEFTGRDILPLKAGLDALAPRRALAPVWFAVLLLVPFIGFIASAVVLRLRRKEDSPERLMADRARQALKAAAVAGNSDTQFLSALYRALVSAIHATQRVMGTSLTWSEARTVLLDMGWDPGQADATAKLLESIESFNYSGQRLTAEKRAQLHDRTRQAVARLVP
jgi:hypothetical protein